MALDLPDGPRDALAAWRDRLIAGRDELRPVPPQALHVTLIFLGYRPEKEIARIGETAFGALGGLAAPLLAAAGARPVPPRRPRLLALDLEDRDGDAVALQAALSEALAAARLYRPEKRPFWPHVTIARVKRDRRTEPIEAVPPPDQPFRAGRVTLYRSTLRREGARYDALASTELTGS